MKMRGLPTWRTLWPARSKPLRKKYCSSHLMPGLACSIESSPASTQTARVTRPGMHWLRIATPRSNRAQPSLSQGPRSLRDFALNSSELLAASRRRADLTDAFRFYKVEAGRLCCQSHAAILCLVNPLNFVSNPDPGIGAMLRRRDLLLLGLTAGRAGALPGAAGPAGNPD